MLIKFVNIENYSLEDFYIDIGEYTFQLDNIGGTYYLGVYFSKSLCPRPFGGFIGDFLAFKLFPTRDYI